MTHLSSANDQTATISEALLDILNDQTSQKDDGLLEELTSEEQFPGIADMIHEILAADGEQ